MISHNKQLLRVLAIACLVTLNGFVGSVLADFTPSTREPHTDYDKVPYLPRRNWEKQKQDGSPAIVTYEPHTDYDTTPFRPKIIVPKTLHTGASVLALALCALSQK